jgi:hypothetical protein
MESWVRSTMASPGSVPFTGERGQWDGFSFRVRALALGIKDLLEVPGFLDMENTDCEQEQLYKAVNARFFMVVAAHVDTRAGGPFRLVLPFQKTTDGRGAFKALEAAYRPITISSKFDLFTKLANPVKASDESITAFFTRLTNIRDQLREMEDNTTVCPDSQLLEAIVRALLRDRNDSFRYSCNYIINTEGITLERAHTILRTAEEHADNSGSTSSPFSGPGGASALFTTGQRQPRGAFRGRCFNCGKVGHMQQQCHAPQQGDGGGGNSGDKPRGDPRRQAGAGASGKHCPIHPTAKHDAKECHMLKANPHLATALAAVASGAFGGAAEGERMPVIRPLTLTTIAPDISTSSSTPNFY